MSKLFVAVSHLDPITESLAGREEIEYTVEAAFHHSFLVNLG